MLIDGTWLVGLGDVAPAPAHIQLRGRLRRWYCSGVHPLKDLDLAVGAATATTNARGRFTLAVDVDINQPIELVFSSHDDPNDRSSSATVYDPNVQLDVLEGFEQLGMTEEVHRGACR